MLSICQNIIQNSPNRLGEIALRIYTSILPNRKVKACVNGAYACLDLRESIQRSMFLGSYEPTQTGWFRECVQEGDTFIDIGASFGHYTTLASSIVGSKGRVFSFEPSPKANQTIEKMIEISDIKNITLIKAAVGKTKGITNLYMPNTDGLHSPSIMKSDDAFTPIEIPVISLDDYALQNNINQIKLIKIDVEGYEPDVLDGMERLLKEKRILNVFCEFNSWWLEQNGATPKSLLERFLGYGFVIHKSTSLQENLVGHKGVSFSLQDIWFKLPTN